MTLRLRFSVYLVVLHLLLAGIAFWQREPLGWWLFPLELLLCVSLIIGLRWVRIAQLPNEISSALPDIIESGEYGTRFASVGHREIDAVIETYNDMLTTLQRERLRLGEQRGFLEHFLAVTPIGIVIFDFDDRVSLINPRAAELLACTADQVTGRAISSVENPLAAALSGLAPGETQLIADETGRRLRCQRSQFVDRGFRRTFILIEELTAELNRSERDTYEKLIRMMSHEVTNTVAATNSLLASFHSYATEFASDEHRADFVNALNVLIERNGNLNEFTSGFSDLVKLPEPQLQPAQIDSLLEPMRTVFRAHLHDRDIRLTIDMDADLPAVPMDRGQLDQVLINVIRNAMEAIDAHGEIEVVAKLDGNRIALSVFDTGPGPDEAAGNALFSPFHTTKKHGQGLGLTVVREILTRHGFGYSLERTGSRTRFRILMPVPKL